MKTLLTGSMTTSRKQEEPETDVVRLLEVQQALRARLLGLNFHAFARCMSELLHRLGYDEVRLAGRLEWKGRNKDGGYDLVAYAPDHFSALAAVGASTSPEPCRKVIVQLKQYGPDLAVHQRCVDELRGACLRAGASEAILITTGDFSKVVQEQAAALAREKNPVASVHLVDGPALLRALVAHGIGVTREADGTARLDAGYFDALAQTSPGNARGARRRSGTNTKVADDGGGGRNDRNERASGAAEAPTPGVTLLVLQLPVSLTFSARVSPVAPAPKGRPPKRRSS